MNQTVPLVLLFYRSPVEPQTNKGENVQQACCDVRNCLLYFLVMENDINIIPLHRGTAATVGFSGPKTVRFRSNHLKGLTSSRAAKLARHDFFGSSGIQQP